MGHLLLSRSFSLPKRVKSNQLPLPDMAASASSFAQEVRGVSSKIFSFDESVVDVSMASLPSRSFQGRFLSVRTDTSTDGTHAFCVQMNAGCH
jgi:hypothetical protein